MKIKGNFKEKGKNKNQISHNSLNYDKIDLNLQYITITKILFNY